MDPWKEYELLKERLAELEHKHVLNMLKANFIKRRSERMRWRIQKEAYEKEVKYLKERLNSLAYKLA